MLSMIKRRFIANQSIKFRPHEDRLLMFSTEVAIKNPATGNVETHMSHTYKPQSPLDEFLRASDFNIDVQLRNGVRLEDCPTYLKPASIEEYQKMLSNFSFAFNSSIEKNVKPTAPVSNTESSSETPSSAVFE